MAQATKVSFGSVFFPHFYYVFSYFGNILRFVFFNQLFMIGIRSFSAFSLPQVVLELEQIRATGFQARLAFVFGSYQIGIPDLQRAFSIFPDLVIFGSSTCGEFLFNQEVALVLEESVVVCLVDSEQDWFRLASFSGKGMNSLDLGKRVGEFGVSAFAHSSLVLVCSGMNVNGQDVVEGAKSTFGDDLIMFGGLAGDDSRFHETYVFTANEILTQGAVVLAVNSSLVEMNGLATSGWIGVGSDLTITHSEGNVVYTIDHQPALEVYKEYLNVQDEDLPGIGVEFPLLLKREGGDVLRAVLSVDKEKKSLIFAGTVPQGAIVNFSSSPGFHVIEETKGEVERFADANPHSDLILLFSCMARHKALGMLISEELEAISEVWKAPLIGFFTYGEIGTNQTTSCDFYNETCSLLRFRFKI